MKNHLLLVLLVMLVGSAQAKNTTDQQLFAAIESDDLAKVKIVPC